MYSLLIIFALSNLLYFALHVTSGGSFPKPLSQKEERECLEKIKDGDREAKDRLIEHNLRLVAHIIKRYYSSIKDQDDLISIGTIGLIKAASTFDYDKGTRFATYASRCIENEILMHFRNLRKSAQDIFISDPIESKPRQIADLGIIALLLAFRADWHVPMCRSHKGFREKISQGVSVLMKTGSHK